MRHNAIVASGNVRARPHPCIGSCWICCTYYADRSNRKANVAKVFFAKAVILEGSERLWAVVGVLRHTPRNGRAGERTPLVEVTEARQTRRPGR